MLAVVEEGPPRPGELSQEAIVLELIRKQSLSDKEKLLVQEWLVKVCPPLSTVACFQTRGCLCGCPAAALLAAAVHCC
jgi:hypothetical protein